MIASEMRLLGRSAFLLALAAAGSWQAIGKDAKVWSDVRKVGESGDSAIAASGQHVYVAYGSNPVFVVRSEDGGITFSPPTRLADWGDMHETDSLAAESNVVVGITFAPAGTKRDWCCDRQLGNLMLYRSTDFGASWLPAFPLTSAGGAFRVSVAMALPFIHVVWSDFRRGHWAIYYRRSTDGGASWEAEQQLVSPGLEETNRPQLAVLGKTVHLVWMDNRDGNGPCYTLPHCTETYYMRSTDAGATWSSARRITFNQPQQPLLSGRPDVAAFGDGSVVIAYDQDLKFGKSSVQHYLRSPDAGVTWEPPALIGQKPEETHPAVSALGRVGVDAWFAQISDAGIFARLTADSGVTWTKKERVTVSFIPANSPHVAVTPGLVHFVWAEGREGTFNVLYRRRVIPAPN